MTEVIINMPKMGESVMEATILQWFKSEGDTVQEGDILLEVATDKVDAEVAAVQTGTLKKIIAQVGDVIAVGAPIAWLETVANLPLDSPVAQEACVPTAEATPLYQPQPAPRLATLQKSVNHRLYSPLARRMAQQAKLTPHVLAYIPGTARHNRVTKRDILSYLQQPYLPPPSPAQPPSCTVHTLAAPGDEIIQMDRVRQLIAKRMVAAKQTVPHVTSVVRADVTALVTWKNQYTVAFKQKTGIKLTYTPFFLQAVVQALQVFPMLNAAVVGEQIIKRKAIHIGLAVALPDDNLIVPVIKHADQLDWIALMHRIDDLAQRARTYQLTPDDLAGATFTVSNIGAFQNLMGTPIIMQPQVAILALGAIVKRPAVVSTQAGDTVAVRHEVLLSHTYDHRVIDGALGCKFAKKVADYLENFDINYVI